MSAEQYTPLTTIDAWLEWKRVCTIGKCSENVVQQLSSFAQKRLCTELEKRDERGLLAKYGEQNKPWAWLELEKHLYAGKTKTEDNVRGKRYKDQLLKTCGETRADLESVVSRIIQRDVLRKILHEEKPDIWNASGKRQKDEGRPREVVSLDAPVNGAEGNTSLYEYLGGEQGEDVEDIVLEPESEADAEAINEYVSDEMVQSWWNAIDERTQKIIACSMAGKSVGEMIESDIFGCKKSQMYQALEATYEKIKNIPWENGSNDRARVFLTGVFLMKLKKIIINFANSPENRVLRCFIEAGIST